MGGREEVGLLWGAQRPEINSSQPKQIRPGSPKSQWKKPRARCNAANSSKSRLVKGWSRNDRQTVTSVKGQANLCSAR